MMIYIYTHNDLDGVGCGILAKLAFGENTVVKYNSISSLDHQLSYYIEKVGNIDGDNSLIITDMSPSDDIAEQLNELATRGAKIQLIDHHKTADHFNEYSWGVVKVAYEDGRLASATSLFYDYLKQHQLIQHEAAIDEFVELVRQYDTWEWDVNQNLKAKRLNDLFFLLSLDEFEEKMIKRLGEQKQFDFDEFEQKLLEMEEGKIERYIRRKRRELIQTFIGDYCVGIVHAESYHSELGNELGKESPHLDYIALLNMGGRKISYRTIHDHVDVSMVADQFGGGGHSKASGSSMSKQAFALFVEDAFTLDPIRLDALKNRFNLKGTAKGVLYDNREGDKFFIYLNSHEKWVVEKNGVLSDQQFESFEDAEYDLKRHAQAALVRDDVFVDYLLQNKHQNGQKG
jgi:uncharacterized protein